MTQSVRLYPIGPRRGIAIFLSLSEFLSLSDEEVPLSGTQVQFKSDSLSGYGIIDHGYIDFDGQIPQDTVMEGTLTWA